MLLFENTKSTFGIPSAFVEDYGETRWRDTQIQWLENPPGEGTRPTGGEFCVGSVTSPGAFSFQCLEKKGQEFPNIGKISYVFSNVWN